MRRATAEDGPALADLLFRNPQEGRLLVGQRRADVFARASAFAESATWLVPASSGAPLGAVSVARKEVRVAGAPVTAGYVFDLVVDAAARGRGLARRLLAAAERWARDRDARLLYASVIGGNAASLAVFHAAGYRSRVPMGMRLYPIFRDRDDGPAPAPDWAAAAQRLRVEGRSHDLVPQALLDDVRGRWSRLPGWRDEDAWITDRAALALWDHRAVSLPVPLRLTGELRLLAAVSRTARRLRIPFPPAPAVGEPLATGYLLAAGGGGQGAARRPGRRAGASPHARSGPRHPADPRRHAAAVVPCGVQRRRALRHRRQPARRSGRGDPRHPPHLGRPRRPVGRFEGGGPVP